MRIILATVVLLIFPIVIQAQSKLSKSDVIKIEKIKEAYRAAWLANDEKGVLSLFWDDAALYPNGLAPQKGIKAVKEFWFAPSDTKTTITNYSITTDEIIGIKNFASASGSSVLEWTMENINGVKRYRSKGLFLTLFLKRNKVWKIYKHIWNGKLEEISN